MSEQMNESMNEAQQPKALWLTISQMGPASWFLGDPSKHNNVPSAGGPVHRHAVIEKGNGWNQGLCFTEQQGV